MGANGCARPVPSDRRARSLGTDDRPWDTFSDGAQLDGSQGNLYLARDGKHSDFASEWVAGLKVSTYGACSMIRLPCLCDEAL